jgi:hypothetical protein
MRKEWINALLKRLALIVLASGSLKDETASEEICKIIKFGLDSDAYRRVCARIDGEIKEEETQTNLPNSTVKNAELEEAKAEHS